MANEMRDDERASNTLQTEGSHSACLGTTTRATTTMATMVMVMALAMATNRKRRTTTTTTTTLMLPAYLLVCKPISKPTSFFSINSACYPLDDIDDAGQPARLNHIAIS